MSLELAKIVLDRAPLTGGPYYTLLYLAMHADHRDFCGGHSAPAIACAMRTRKRVVRNAIHDLEQKGFISCVRWGHRQNPWQCYHYVLREALLACPKAGRLTQEPKPRSKSKMSPQILALIEQRAASLVRFRNTPPEQLKKVLEDFVAIGSNST